MKVVKGNTPFWVEQETKIERLIDKYSLFAKIIWGTLLSLIIGIGLLIYGFISKNNAIIGVGAALSIISYITPIILLSIIIKWSWFYFKTYDKALTGMSIIMLIIFAVGPNLIYPMFMKSIRIRIEFISFKISDAIIGNKEEIVYDMFPGNEKELNQFILSN
ncbi:hypothetical protein [Mycoplasma sp. E35C]|uniref:hypothetical protein n=1 Tax=Mycoplasma sp. E35C TaxID=2801918 RepID=UPI001CA45F41|nr:hypothetical protein [Mycoplasma sp. E35C]QZX49472.1 hypothetical protein JJE79_01865 [Mycoplasma sp. E35C]